MMSKTPADEPKTEVFDVSKWLDRATVNRPPAEPDYVPKHRAEEPAV